MPNWDYGLGSLDALMAWQLDGLYFCGSLPVLAFCRLWLSTRYLLKPLCRPIFWLVIAPFMSLPPWPVTGQIIWVLIPMLFMSPVFLKTFIYWVSNPKFLEIWQFPKYVLFNFKRRYLALDLAFLFIGYQTPHWWSCLFRFIF